MIGRLFRSSLKPSLYVARGVSMEPTLRDGDLLLALAPRRHLARGDVVILRPPRGSGAERGVKRVVGLPGERIDLEDGMLFVDGVRLPEPYLAGLPASVGLGAQSISVGAGECAALGDNRAHSVDSRRYGAIPLTAVEGIVSLRLWRARAHRRLLR